MTITRRAIVGALAATALALPASAAAQPDVSVGSVTAHTTRSDAALERAQALFGAAHDGQAAASFRSSRAELGRAGAGAATLVRQAGTPAERARAARALRAVAAQRDENIERLTELLGEAEGGAERAIAAAALADTRGRDKAIAALQGVVVRGVAPKAALGLVRAIAALSTDRDEEVGAGAAALAAAEVSDEAKETLAEAIDANLRGQARAAAILQALMGRLPAAAQAGLAQAHSRVAAEQEAGAQSLAGAAEQMPDAVRAIVEEAAGRAGADASTIRDNPPAGQGVAPGPASGSAPSPPASGAQPRR